MADIKVEKMYTVVIEKKGLESIILQHLRDVEDVYLEDGATFNYCISDVDGEQQLKVTVKGREN